MRSSAGDFEHPARDTGQIELDLAVQSVEPAEPESLGAFDFETRALPERSVMSRQTGIVQWVADERRRLGNRGPGNISVVHRVPVSFC